VLAQGKSVSEVTLDTYHPGLHLLPGSRRLADYERHLTPVKEARQRMARALAPVASSYDYVVFDTPPTLGLLTVSALIASTELVIPMQAHFLALDGLAEMIRIVGTIDRFYANGLRIRGVVPTFYQERTRLSRAVMEDVRSHLGPDSVLPAVRSCISLAEAPSHGETIFQYAPRSSGALDYEALAARVDGGTDSAEGVGTEGVTATTAAPG
jgi:chromosome partitioning protein